MPTLTELLSGFTANPIADSTQRAPQHNTHSTATYDAFSDSNNETFHELGDFDIDRISESWLDQCIADLDWQSWPAA